MEFNTLFKKRLFSLIIFVIPLSSYLGDLTATIFNLNNTMGWRFVIMNTTVDRISGLIPIIFIVSYALMSFNRISTHVVLSKIHLVSVSIFFILASFTDIDFKIIFMALGISLIIFIFNMYFSFMNRKTISA